MWLHFVCACHVHTAARAAGHSALAAHSPVHPYAPYRSYREASDIIKKGKMSSLFINDLDAGAGRMGDATQVR